MHRPSKRRLSSSCRSTLKGSSVDTLTSHGRFRHWTLPSHLQDGVPASLRCNYAKRPFQRISTSSDSSCIDQRSSDAHSSTNDEAEQSATTRCPRSSLEGLVPSKSSSSGRTRRRSSSEDDCDDESWRTATTFLRLSDSRKLARNRRLRHPHKWIRTCHIPPVKSTKETSRVRLIVSEEISSSYSHLFSRDDVWEPYDPETYQDNNYLTIPRFHHRGCWRSPSLDRISELSQTSLTTNSSDKKTSRKFSECSSLSPTDLPARTVCRNASTPESVEPPVSSSRVELARAPARSRLFKSIHRLESGDKETPSDGRKDKLQSAVKEIESRLSAVAQCIVTLERKNPEIVPQILYSNLKAIQRKLQETRLAINESCNPPRKEISGKSMAIAKSANSVIKCFQSLSSESDESAEGGEGDKTSSMGVCSLRSLPRRQTHRRSLASRRRRCPHVQKLDRSLRSAMAYPSDTQSSASDWLSCHKAMKPSHHPNAPLPEIEGPPDRVAKPTPRSQRSGRGPRPIPHILSHKCSLHLPPRRLRYLPELPATKAHYHMCAACKRLHRLLSPVTYEFCDPVETEPNEHTCHPYLFTSPPPSANQSAPNTTDTKALPDSIMRNLPDNFMRNLPENLRRHMPDELRKRLPDNSRKELPGVRKNELDSGSKMVQDNCSRTLPDNMGRQLPDSFSRVPVDCHQNYRNCQSSVFFPFSKGKPACVHSPGSRNQSTYIPQCPVDNSRRRLPTCLTRRRLKLHMERQALQPQAPLQSKPEFREVFSPNHNPSEVDHGQFCSSVTHYPCCCHYRNPMASRYTSKYVSSPHESLSHLSASSAHRARTARPKIRRGRSNIVAARSDDYGSDSSEFGEKSSRSEVSVRESYTVVLKCARINVYVDRGDEEHSIADDKACSPPVYQCVEQLDMQNANCKSEVKLQPQSASTSCREGVGDQLFPEGNSRGLYNSFTRMKVSPAKGDALGAVAREHPPRRHFKRVGARECNGFADSCDRSEKLRRLAKSADARTELSSGSSVTSDARETSSSPLESDWPATSSSSREKFGQLKGKTDGEINKEDSAACRDDLRRCSTSVSASASVTNAPRPMRRWLVLGSEWTPTAEENSMQAVFDTPSQTAPLMSVKGNDFGNGTKRDTTLTKPADLPSSSVAFPVDVTCSYTASGHRIESCVASYVFAQPGSQGLPVPLEASVVPPDEEEIANLSFKRMGNLTLDGKSPPKPLVVFPQSVDSILSPSGHHLESCCAHFVFLDDDAISRKSLPSGSRERPDTMSAPSRTFVVLPFFRATPLHPEIT